MQTPKVSVVMPVYNEERYLRQSIESILKQTYQDFEFIIVDGGSTDSTPSILKEYAENNRVKILTSEKYLSITECRNKGIMVANGKYIAVQDADDVSLPERIKKQVEYLEKNNDVILLGTQAYTIDEEGKIIAKMDVPVGYDRIRKILSRTNCLIHGSVMFRKKEVGLVGFYREELGWADDHDLYLRVMKIGKLDNLPEPLYMWRLRRKSISMEKMIAQKEFSKLDPETFYRYRLCRTLTWGGNFERARKEISTLVKEKYLTPDCIFKLMGCHVVTLLGPGSVIILRKVKNILSSFGYEL